MCFMIEYDEKSYRYLESFFTHTKTAIWQLVGVGCVLQFQAPVLIQTNSCTIFILVIPSGFWCCIQWQSGWWIRLLKYNWLLWYIGAKNTVSVLCWNIVNWTLWNKFQWNFNRNSSIFIHANEFESVVCEMAAILSRLLTQKGFNQIKICLSYETKANSHLQAVQMGFT